VAGFAWLFFLSNKQYPSVKVRKRSFGVNRVDGAGTSCRVILNQQDSWTNKWRGDISKAKKNIKDSAGDRFLGVISVPVKLEALIWLLATRMKPDITVQNIADIPCDWCWIPSRPNCKLSPSGRYQSLTYSMYYPIEHVLPDGTLVIVGSYESLDLMTTDNPKQKFILYRRLPEAINQNQVYVSLWSSFWWAYSGGWHLSYCYTYDSG
jgi:hypothetical protein